MQHILQIMQTYEMCYIYTVSNIKTLYYYYCYYRQNESTLC